MTTVDAVSGFSRLVTLGLISEAQCEAGARHPRCDEAEAYDGLVQQLIWMVRERIVSHAKLLAIRERSISAPGDQNQRERNTVLSQALPQLDAMSPSLNETLLDSLLKDGLITKDEHVSTMAQAFPIVFASEAQALAHVVDCGVMPLARFDALAEQIQREEASETRARRLFIVEEASNTVLALRMAQVALDSASEKSGTRGWFVLFLVTGIMLFAGYKGFQWLDAAPACGSSAVTKPILSKMTSMAGTLDPAHVFGSPKLTDIREVGHVSARHQRGCTARLELDGESQSFSYVIAPVSDTNETMTVTGTHPAIVEARFARIGSDGDFANKAEPIGRDALEAAMRAVMGDDRPTLSGLLNPMDPTKALLSHIIPERTREIAEIEPIGACRELQRGARYACKVMVERNDPILQMVGRPSEIVEGEFTFEPTGEPGHWRVSDDFQSEFASALHAARVKAAGGGKS